MGYRSQLTHDRLAAADSIQTRLDSRPCGECTDSCSTLNVYAVGTYDGATYRTCVMFREHITFEEGLRAQGRFLMAQVSIATERAAAAWLIEHQPELW